MANLIVYIFLDTAWVPCGRLAISGAGRNASARFGYAASYLARAGRIAIDPVQLPLPEDRAPRVYETPEGFEVFNGIRDAAPDGWGRHLLESYAEGKALTEADFLAGSSFDRVGALAFGPDLNGPRRWLPSLDIGIEAGPLPGERVSMSDLASDVEDIEEAIANGDIVSRDRLVRFLVRGSSLGGARPKATVASDTIDLRDTGENLAGHIPWIAKFSRHDDDYNVPRAEWIAMELARRCGLKVPETRLVDLAGPGQEGKSVYLIRRFDRTLDGHPIPFISALTILGAHESDRNMWGYADIADALRTHGGLNVTDDLTELFDRMAFNAFVRNEDDHLRNHGFLWRQIGWRLSPLYDVTPAPAVGTEIRLALGIGENGRVASRENLLSLAPRFGLSAEEAEAHLLHISRTVIEELPGLRNKAGLSAADWRRLETCFDLARTCAEGPAASPRP